MKRSVCLLAAFVCCVIGPAYALYSVADHGLWPKSWPRAMEPLRIQARTLVGPEVESRHYAIRFTKREQFDAVWPEILKVKSKNAPIFLVHGPNFFLGDNAKAGVVIHTPPAGRDIKPGAPGVPINGVENPHVKWMNANTIDVVVDDDIVSVDRLKLPKSVVVIDERARSAAGAKPGASSGASER
ncbi:MAG TPA: hypothetical protein VKT77_10645 [Chthonomonadaceae bacterium]|nr:hypothetical protein [Chthonomonadaceae bacterium]